MRAFFLFDCFKTIPIEHSESLLRNESGHQASVGFNKIMYAMHEY